MTIKRVVLGTLMITLVLLSGCKEQTLAVGAPAPDLAVIDANEQQMTLQQVRGKPVVVEFWSSTCGACLVMMKAWQKYADDHPGKMQFIGVGIEPHPENLTDFAAQLGVKLPLGLDQLGITQERYQVMATPTTFFIDRHGVLKMVHLGYSSGMDLDHYVNLIQE
ncbi:Thiol-disulfide oxidoreductase ResA [Vibrio ruber DSM 16370]|uniref:Thiol-disulfide oxidoreductase ResA n=1 Tax=Vibrio ruber (strain DSM 16370 / JCM 11486 / BCRC 17186 / CECT 7878 / LMG 23124 / VR1) TaxID=1123498 RepID=A0A1R4LE85_VIBR1|nr:TlpA disulfide reductase family protein [Vibrio ruber]SJN54881.1 Thiol-disulfide oxidoreductase ResA [Vibrio ruber DSM 16370]